MGQAFRWEPGVWPLDGNGNFRLCSHALGKSNVSIDEFSLYFLLVYMVDEEYKQISKQIILWLKLVSHVLTVNDCIVTEKEKSCSHKSEYFFDWSTIIIPCYKIKSYKVH